MRVKCVLCGLATAALLAGCGPAQPVDEPQLSPTQLPSAKPAQLTPAPTASPDATPEPTPEPERTYTPVDKSLKVAEPAIVIYKARRSLELHDGDTLAATYSIGLGSSPQGHKQKEGDCRTPEGEYYVCLRNDKSRYYLSLGLSYPNEADARAGLDSGLITQAQYDDIAQAIAGGRRPPWDTPLGGEIMIHGRGGGQDWTLGCVAVDDDVMDVLWANVSSGVKVTICP